MRTSSHTQNLEAQLSSLLENLSEHRSPVSLAELDGVCRSLGVKGHLAVLNEPYLSWILSGRKQIESRFSRVRVAPYQRVTLNDILFLKESSGLIKAVAAVAGVEYHGPLAPGEAEALIEKHKVALALEESFVDQKRNAIYATLITLGSVRVVPPLSVNKRDRRGWVVLCAEQGVVL
jgi:hypothetical protein